MNLSSLVMQKVCLKIVDKSRFIAGDIINAEAHPNSASRAGQIKASSWKSQSYMSFLRIRAKKILQDNIRTVSTRCSAIYKLGLNVLRQTESL